MSNGTHCRHGIHYGDMCAKCQPIYTEEECRAAINAAVELALEAAPQAQEEPSGAPAPTVQCLYCGKVSDLGRGAVVYEPQPPAPASPGGSGYRLLMHYDHVQDGDEFLEDDAETWTKVPPLYHGKPYTRVFQPMRRPKAAPEAGAPGTQGAT